MKLIYKISKIGNMYNSILIIKSLFFKITNLLQHILINMHIIKIYNFVLFDAIH